MIRKLYLVNDLGNPYYFDFRSHTLISSLAGLGISADLTYLKYDNLYVPVEKKFPLNTINATLIFLKGYNGYSAFLEYLKNSKSLRLYYQSDNLKYCNVEIKSISKRELVSSTLQCDISFDKLSLWQKDSQVEIEVNTNNHGKVYPYTYPFYYSKSFEGKVIIKNNGAVKAPLNIEIIGDVKDPEINIIKEGVILSTMRLFITALASDIIISSIPSNQFIVMRELENYQDIYQHQDFTCDNFLFIDVGEYEIEFKPGVSSNTLCLITMIEGYLGN